MGGLLTVVFLLAGAWVDNAYKSEREIWSWLFVCATAVLWLVLVLRWAYRGGMYIYRLTPRHLFVDRGFLYGPEPPVVLSRVTAVEWGAGWLGAMVGVGWIAIWEEGRTVPVVLKGIVRPAEFAERVQVQATQAR